MINRFSNAWARFWGLTPMLAIAALGVSAQTLTNVTPAPIKKILKKFEEPSALDQFVEQAHKRAAANEASSPGSLYSGGAGLGKPIH